MDDEGRVASAARPSRAASTFVVGAPYIFVLLWSTGFVVAHYGTEDAGPLTFLAVRLAIAAAALATYATLTKAPSIGRTAVGWAAVSGLGMHAVYLGGVFLAISWGMPSGVSALIAGLHPVLTILVARWLLGERLVKLQWIGVALGFTGVVVVVVDHMSDRAGDISTGALIAAGVSVVGMSAGTLVQRRHGTGMPLLRGTVVQYTASATVLFVGAVFHEHLDFTVTQRSMFALLWAVVVLSIAAVLIMLWLLQRHAAAKVSSLFFLTPALSTLEGAILFGERLGPLAILGLVIALVGVSLTLRARR
ncbi:MAG: DMT family transporter [Ilumatobacteraceae bacterium]